MFWMYPRNKVWDCGMTINGFLAGLVAITCPCYWVSPFGAIMIGAIAGPVCALVVDLLEYLRIDDPVGAVAVHGGARHLGHAQPRPLRHRPVRRADADGRRQLGGLGRHGPVLRRRHQPARRPGHRQRRRHRRRRSASRWRSCTLTKFTIGLRVSKEGELEGLDLHEHGGGAYPEQMGGIMAAHASGSGHAPAGAPVPAKAY